jgi:predicted nucleotidyltransferase
VERPATDNGIDISRAAERIRRLQRADNAARAQRYAEAQCDLERALDAIRAFPQVQRVRVWGSLLRPDRFTEMSDIDICVEGVSSPTVWSELEQRLLAVVQLPLDLVRWEDLMQPHRESIEARGKVVYESGW